MQTEIVAAHFAIDRAVALLRAGEVVALPTETVYGLAADVYNANAVAKVFETKERPHFDPLIVHLPSREMLDFVARTDSRLARELMDKFWPGPLTIVLPRREAIPDIVTAGLETVAVRMSAHPVFREIISVFGGPLAAPSANRFGRISPTSAQHVKDELAGRIPLIVDDGATTHGIESTIVRVMNDTIEILRQGPIAAKALRQLGRVRVNAPDGSVIAPGQMATHYAPRTKLILVEKLEDFLSPPSKRIGALAFASASTSFAALRQLSRRGDVREAAANLFRMLRELDNENLDFIVAERVPNEDVGIAINERLKRGATPDARAPLE